MEETKVSASSVNVRSGPSTSKKKLGVLKRGETIQYTSHQNGWLQMQYKNQVAYVASQYTTYNQDASQTTQTTVQQSVQEPAQEVSSPSESTGKKVTISANKVNIRNGASTGAKRVGQENKGASFTHLGTEGDWYKIEYKGQVAYVMTKFADEDDSVSQAPVSTPDTSTATESETTTAPESMPQAQAPTTTTDAKIMIKSDKVNIRQAASTGSKRLGQASKGQTFPLIATEGDWYKIEYKGQIAYVMTKFAKDANATDAYEPPGTSAEAQEQALTGKLKYASNTFVRGRSKSGRHVKRLYDLNTGKSFDISWARPSGTYHSDVTPNDKAATDTVKSIVNPSVSPGDYEYWSKGRAWDWSGHPGAMQLDNGVWVACGYHLRPHGAPQGGSPDNPWNQSSPKSRPDGYTSRTPEGKDKWKPGGHFCLYYNEDNGGGTKSCREAVLKAKNMRIPV